MSDKPRARASLPLLTDEQVAALDRLYGRQVETLQGVDEWIGLIHDQLQRLGLLDRTYILFLSDNGQHAGEHRLPPGKSLPYEEDLRVPLVVLGPGVAAGGVRDELVLNIDLAPTVMDLAGAGTPPFVDARSFASLLVGGGIGAVAWRRSFLVEHWATLAMSVAPERWWWGVRTDRYIFIRYASGEAEVYDLEEDPHQLQSVHASLDPKVLDGLSTRLDALRDCAAVGCRAAEAR